MKSKSNVEILFYTEFASSLFKNGLYMEFIEVTLRSGGSGIYKMLINRSHIVSVLPYNEKTHIETTSSDGVKILVEEPYSYVRALLTGKTDFRCKDEYEF